VSQVSQVLSGDAPEPILRLYQYPYLLLDPSKRYFDVGAGDNLHTRHLDVIPLDIDDWDLNVSHNPLERPEGEVDEAVCFQVIEHIEDEALFMANLRILCRDVRIGTVNKDVWPFFEGVEVFMGSMNPYHINEYSRERFNQLERHFESGTFYSQIYDNAQFVMVEGLYANALNFYIHGRLR
jgi:hypothetical protein|tara:strand:+ start:793 stop:1335 length:543 start_codon:yes stop_codon:yes gene_type:complete